MNVKTLKIKAMKERRPMGRMIAMAGVLAVAAAVCFAQQSELGTGQNSGLQTGTQSGSQTGTPSGSHQPGPAGSLDPWDPNSSPFPDTTKQKRNEDRQRRLVSDAQKLLALTSQLKNEVASSGAETMSPEMLKQTEEIEKLAKSVKDKMRD